MNIDRPVGVRLDDIAASWTQAYSQPPPCIFSVLLALADGCRDSAGMSNAPDPVFKELDKVRLRVADPLVNGKEGFVCGWAWREDRFVYRVTLKDSDGCFESWYAAEQLERV